MKNLTIRKLFRFVYTVPLSILLAGCTYVETESLDNELSQVLPSCNKRLHEYFAQNNMPKFIRGKVSILEKKDLRDSDHNWMNTKWQASITYKLNLEDLENVSLYKSEGEDYFIICKYITSSLKDNKGVTSIKIFSNLSLPASKVE